MNRMRLVCWVAATLVIAACGSSGSTGGTNTANAYAGKTIKIGASLEDATWDLALRLLPEEWWDRRTVELAAATRAARPRRAAEH